MVRRFLAVGSLATTIALGHFAVSTQTQAPQQPRRDTPAQQQPQAAGTAQIAGRVVTADSGRPVRRARLQLSGSEIPGGRGVLTDDNGAFEFTGLPAGRFTLNASKVGFVTISYGQRRPLQAGTPLQVTDGQQLTGLDMRLPRGSAVTGHIYDETGEPLPRARVLIARYQYAQGNRQLIPAGSAETDDLGAYRIWGLEPGDYYLSATARLADLGGRGAIAQVAQGGRGGRGAIAEIAGRGAARGGFEPLEPADSVGYAPTFYPGVPSASESRPIAVGLSAEVTNIDFGILLIQTARVSGRVVSPDGSTGAGMVNLMPDADRGGRAGGMPLGGGIRPDGSFTIANVPPGRYTLRARSGDRDAPRFAAQPLTVEGSDLPNVTVMLAAPATITGTVTFQATQATGAPNASQLRIVAPPVDFADGGGNRVARVAQDGSFTIEGVAPGPHWIRPQMPPRGWSLKSVVVGGRDVTDTPIELESGRTLSGVALTFTDRLSEIAGTITDNRGEPITEFTILAFSDDETLWRPQSRQIMTARPDQNGKYQIRGLPPGAYYVVAIDPGQQGEWFEPAFLEQHRQGAARLTLAEGDVKTQDFSIK